MDGVVAYILGKSYTKKSLIGIGALAGAPCQVQSINKVGKTTTITLKWEDNVGGVHTQAFEIEDGLDGVSVTNAVINSTGNLILTLSDGNDIDCGKVLPQYDTMPPASSTNVNQILQYIGTTGGGYTNGYYYKCINDGGVYKWVNIKVQDGEDVFRYNVIPSANASISGAIIQYIGVTNANYTNGYYYQCVESPVGSGTYIWVQKNVQPNNGGGGGDGVVDGYYNSADQLFYEDSAFLNPITGEDNTIYVDLNTNGLYRYNGIIFIKVSSSAESIQVITLPTADVAQLDKIYQYIGVTDTNYTKGYFYRCILDGSVYKWVEILTQDSYTKAEIGQLSDLPDPTKTVIENIDVLNGSLANIDKEKLNKLAPIYLIGSGLTLDTTAGSPTYGKLQATGMSIPVDDKLDASSLNPVQNKVITLTIDQLQGSVLDKIQKMLGAQEDNFTVIDNNGGVKDSGISKNIVPATASISNKLLVASDLSVKADKVSGAVDNDIALLDNTGNLKDSNKKLSDLQDKLTEGDGIDIDTNNKISVDITYLTASRVGYIPSTEKGTNNGVAELDSAGKVPSAQLPSYVDDVIEGYKNGANFYTDSAHTNLITPESGKIYVDLHTNTTYRWGGTAYIQISESLALGETSSTAYRGDRGKTAYDHSQITDGSNPHNTTADNVNLKVPIPALSGSKLDVESTLYGINTELGKKADKVTSATNGHLAGLDSNGNLTDSGIGADDVYVTTDTAEITIDDADYFPFYDTSATTKKKTLWSNIKEKLKNYFDSIYPKVTESLLKDTVGWVGKNRLKIPSSVVSSDIYTVNRNGDGEVTSIVANGTPSAQSNFQLVENFTLDEPMILSGCPSGGSVNDYFIYAKDSSNNYYYDYGDGVTLPSGSYSIMQITTRANVSMSNKEFRPMLRKASITDSTFEPYHDNVDYVKVNRDEMKDTIGWSCKNKLPLTIDNLKSWNVGTWSDNIFTMRQVTFDVKTDEYGNVTNIIVNGTPTDGPAMLTVLPNTSQNLPFNFGDKYSGCPFGGSVSTYSLEYRVGLNSDDSQVASKSSTDVGRGNIVKEFDTSTEHVRMYIRIDNSYTANNLEYQVMVRDADIVDDTYEPYHPSVEQTLRDAEVIEGKNLLPLTTNYSSGSGVTWTINEDGTISASGTASSSNDAQFGIPLPKNLNGKYKFTGCPIDGGSGTYDVYLWDNTTSSRVKKWNGIDASQSDTNGTFHEILIDNTHRIDLKLRIFSNKSAPTSPFKPMICLAEEEDSTFEKFYIPLKDSKFDRAEQRVLGAKNVLKITIAEVRSLNTSGTWSGNTYTKNGVTFAFSVDASGYVTGVDVDSNGSSVSTTTDIGIAKNPDFEGNKDFIMSGCPSGGSASTYKLQYSNQVNAGYDDIGNGVVVRKFDYSTYPNSIVQLRIYSGTTPNHLMFKPMLRLASDPDDTYVPYAMTNRELTDKILLGLQWTQAGS